MLNLLPKEWGYEHDIESGAGLPVLAGRSKVVLHTTESSRGSYSGVRALWRGPGKWSRGLPHFLIDGLRVVQLLPLTVNAYTLENLPGGVETNKAGNVIQAEVCSYSADEWDDDTYHSVGKLLGDLQKAGLDFDLSQCPRWYGPNEGIVLATTSSPIRIHDWANYNGWCAHQHVSENAHWDCGYKDCERLRAIAAHTLGIEPIETHKEDDMASIIVEGEGHAWECNGLFRRVASPDDVNWVKYFGGQVIPAGPDADRLLHKFTPIPRDGIKEANVEGI